ncbi:MAG: phosphoglycolate phosphatase [Cyanobacteria bacterium RYN_339]|nr:phosphoglycolate phosphatase [Cyanobacteria bacterium RYN_339]
MPAIRRLVLFDIDGTLLSAAGAGRHAIRQALAEAVGEIPAADSWVFAGKTDPQLTRELLEHHGVAADEVLVLIPRVLARYLELLEAHLGTSADAHLKPGVEALLAALAGREGVCVGLLTGNLADGAQAKLRRFGLTEHFRLGAFGSDHAERHQLPAIAVRRAAEATGITYAGKEIVIIGDTEHDIRCGAALGVTAIAVATGPYGMEELASHGPDHVFGDLGDTAAVLAAILGRTCE